MKKVFSIIAIIPLLFNCKEEEEKPKVKYDSTPEKVVVKQDTSKLVVADLPIQFQNSNVLLFPLGEVRVSEIKRGSYDSEKIDNTGFNVSNILEEEITGYLQNLKFQEIGKDSLHVLTDKPILIERVNFLKSKKLLVYTLADADTNQDSKIDSDDIKALYVSTDLGKNFTKISPDVQELVDWSFNDASNKIYFRTIEDINKNGAFDTKDKLHYFTVNVTKEWKAEEFNIIK